MRFPRKCDVRTYLLNLLLLVGIACTDESLPPDAYGVFIDSNDRAFDSKLNVSDDEVVLFVSLALPGFPRRPPLECRSGTVSGGLKARMNVTLMCRGESIPYSFEFRRATNDWVIQDDESAPQIFVRR